MRDRHGSPVRAQLDDVLRAGADLRVPRVHAAPHRELQRGERAATASCGRCSTCPGRSATCARSASRAPTSSSRGRRSSTALVEPRRERVCREAFASYQRMLEAGVAREVARIVLPLTIYSSMYVTMNARSLMNFLSLRTTRDGARVPVVPAARDRDVRGADGGALGRPHAADPRRLRGERPGRPLIGVTGVTSHAQVTSARSQR